MNIQQRIWIVIVFSNTSLMKYWYRNTWREFNYDLFNSFANSILVCKVIYLSLIDFKKWLFLWLFLICAFYLKMVEIYKIISMKLIWIKNRYNCDFINLMEPRFHKIENICFFILDFTSLIQNSGNLNYIKNLISLSAVLSSDVISLLAPCSFNFDIERLRS